MAIEVIEANGALDAALCKVARTIFSVLKARDKNEPLVIGVCGGRSIVGLLTSLKNEAADQPKDLMERVHFFMVDERLVPLANEQSNFGGLQRLLFDELVLDGSLKSEQLHPFVSDDAMEDFGCARYQEELARFGGAFSVVVLGVGEDGHIAGLFPHHPALACGERGFVSFLDSPKPPAQRMTASAPLIADAELSIVLMLGEGKRAAWEAFRSGKASFESCPALIATQAKSCVVVTDLV